MNVSKKQISNTIFILFIIVFLFTPVGFHIKVYLNRFLSFSPSVVTADNQKKLSSYTWNLETTNAEFLAFEKLKGEVVIINFWATWCPPCIAEMPSFQKLYDDYGDKVTFLFVALDEKEKVSNFILNKKYTFPIFYERSTRPNLLESPSIPATYVIDTKGRIIVSKTGAANWNSDTFRAVLDTLLD